MNARDVEGDELAFMNAVFERYACFMAVIAGQSAVDALTFVCDEAAVKLAANDLPVDAAQHVLTEFRKIKDLAQQAFAAGQRH